MNFIVKWKDEENFDHDALVEASNILDALSFQISKGRNVYSIKKY